MMKKLYGISLAVAIVFSCVAVQAQRDPDVGGASMYPTKNIVQNAVNSNDHTILVAAVKAAGLVDTLQAWAFHSICANQRGLRQAVGGRGGRAAEAGEQGSTYQDSYLPSVAGRLTEQQGDILPSTSPTKSQSTIVSTRCGCAACR